LKNLELQLDKVCAKEFSMLSNLEINFLIVDILEHLPANFRYYLERIRPNFRAF
jgi:hypothetical protein